MMIHKLLPTLLLFLCLVCTSFAQNKSWEGGLMLGAAALGGDMIENNAVFLKQANLGYGIMLRRRFGNNLSARVGFHRGKFTSDDAKSDREDFKDRNFSSSTNINDLGINLEFDILGHRRYRDGKFHKILSPYIFGGVGLAFFDATTNFNGSTSTEILADMAAGGNNSELAFPIGAGVRLDLTPLWGIALEAAPRAISSDLLDGVSQAGNPAKDDAYTFTGIQVWRRFGKVDKDGDGIADYNDACPDVAGPEATMGCPDADGDKIADKDDACPEIAGIPTMNGCPDSDEDGITDADDDCPYRAGTIATKGCPDSDQDGIADKDDPCPNDKGTAESGGCPDTDGDGVVDKDDRCPDVAGASSAKGCPDNDGDGVANAEDACPDVAGTFMAKGCPDKDGDSVADKDDKCPDEKGLHENDGCPEKVVVFDDEFFKSRGIVDLLFDTDKDNLRNRSDAVLDLLVSVMKEYSELNIIIDGHADSRESDAYNMRLSEERAQSALDYLVRKGISADRLEIRNFGERNPIATNDTDTGRQLNRRVEFKVKE